MPKSPHRSAETARKRAMPHEPSCAPVRHRARELRRPVLALLLGFVGCTAEPKSGVYSCALDSDCPGHQQCDLDQRLCFERAPGDVQRTDDVTGTTRDNTAGSGESDPSGAAADGGRGAGGAGGGPRSGGAASGGTGGRARSPGDSPDQPEPAAPSGGRSGSPGSNSGPGSGDDQPGSSGPSSGSAANGGSHSGNSNAGSGPDAGSSNPPANDPPDAGSSPPRAGAGGDATPSQDAGRSAADGGSPAGRGPEPAGMSAPPPAGSPAPTPPPCPTGGFCYGFERGVLDPTGELWPSPIESGRLPSEGQLSTLEFPASSGNHVLVATPNAVDPWPKAVVGMTRHDAYSKLTVEFDFAHTASLAPPIDPVVITRVATVQGDTGNGLDVLIDNDGALWVDIVHLDAKWERSDRVAALAETTRLTRVRLVLTRGSSCNVTITYGDSSKTVPMHCDLSDYQVEFGLNVLKPSDQPYRADYSAYYDNLTVSSQ